MIKINCTSWRPHDGACLHQAAPRKIFFAQQCILNGPNPDPRIPAGCALCTPHPKPPRVSEDNPPPFLPARKPEPPQGEIRRLGTAQKKPDRRA